jgi:hypothetical protein
LQFPVQIAGFSVNVECQDRGLANYLSRELENYEGGDGGDATARISLEFVEQNHDLQSENSNVTLIRHPFGPDILLDARSNPESLEVHARVIGAGEEITSYPEELYSFLATQLFTLLLQHLESNGKAHVLLVHACGAASEGKGFLFAGASGSGKSTVAARLKKMPSVTLLGDELIALAQHGEGGEVQMYSFPVVSDISRAEISNIGVPLEAIFFLSPGEATSCIRADTAHAAADLLGVLIPPVSAGPADVGLGEKQLAGSMELLMDEAVKLSATVPCFHLSLSLDDEPWDRILHDEGQKGENQDE